MAPRISSALRFFIPAGVAPRGLEAGEVEGGSVTGGFSTRLRTVTTRVTTMGFVALGPSEVVAAEDRSAFFVVLDFEKNEESDAEGRTTVSDIIMDWVEGEGLGTRAVPLECYHRSRGLRSVLSHTSIPFPQTHRGWSMKMGPS